MNLLFDSVDPKEIDNIILTGTKVTVDSIKRLYIPHVRTLYEKTSTYTTLSQIQSVANMLLDDKVTLTLLTRASFILAQDIEVSKKISYAVIHKEVTRLRKIDASRERGPTKTTSGTHEMVDVCDTSESFVREARINGVAQYEIRIPKKSPSEISASEVGFKIF